MGWGVMASWGLAFFQGAVTYSGALAQRDAAMASAQAYADAAERRQTLLTKQLHNEWINYSSNERRTLDEQGAAKELLLARSDQLLGRVKSQYTGAKSGSGTSLDLVESQRNQASGALYKLVQAKLTGQAERASTYKSRKTLIQTMGDNDIKELESTADVMRQNATRMFDHQRSWGVASAFFGGLVSGASAFTKKSDWIKTDPGKAVTASSDGKDWSSRNEWAPW